MAVVCIPVLPIQIDNSQRVKAAELGKMVTPSFTEIEHIIFAIHSARRGGHFRQHASHLRSDYVAASASADHPLSGIRVIDAILESPKLEESESFWTYYWFDVSCGYFLVAVCVYFMLAALIPKTGRPCDHRDAKASAPSPALEIEHVKSEAKNTPNVSSAVAESDSGLAVASAPKMSKRKRKSQKTE